MSWEGILIWAGFGLAVGVVAKYIMPGKDGVGLITTSLVGLVGSVVGIFVGNYFGFTSALGELSILSFFTAIVGALLVLVLLKLVKVII